MYNMKVAQSNQFVVTIGGQKRRLSAEKIAALIKKKLSESKYIHGLFEHYEMDVSRLDDLVIQIMPLEKKYAETDADSMRLNTILFDTGDFFRDYFFVIPHELVHWMSRLKEAEAYFNDPEEVLGFVASVAHEIEAGTDPDEIWNKIYPKISWHFHDENDAREFFVNMIDKAKDLIGNGG